MRKIVLSFFVALLVLLAGLCLVDSKFYASFVEQYLISSARYNNIRLALEDTRLSGLGLIAPKVELFLSKYLLSLELTELKLKLSPVDLFFLSPVVSFSAESYNGEISGRLKSSLLKVQTGLELNLSNLDLSLHPQLQGFGISSGGLNATLTNFNTNSDGIQAGLISLNVSKLNKPQESSFYLPVSGLPMKISIPNFNDLSMSIALRFVPKTCYVEAFTSNSSLAVISGQGVLTTAKSHTWKIEDMEIIVNLSDTGLKFAGLYLPLVSAGRLSATSKDFSVRISRQGHNQKATFKLLYSK